MKPAMFVPGAPSLFAGHLLAAALAAVLGTEAAEWLRQPALRDAVGRYAARLVRRRT